MFCFKEDILKCVKSLWEPGVKNNKVAPEIKYNLLSFNNELVEIRVHKSAKVMSLYLISCKQKKSSSPLVFHFDSLWGLVVHFVRSLVISTSYSVFLFSRIVELDLWQVYPGLNLEDWRSISEVDKIINYRNSSKYMPSHGGMLSTHWLKT